MATVALVVHPRRPLAGTVATEMVDWLTANGHEVRIPMADAERLLNLEKLGVAPEELVAGLDLAVSIGGDGTMLRTVHEVVSAGVPVLGVNLGHLGYLTEVEPAGWRSALERFFAGDFHLAERMTLQVELRRQNHTETRVALNDAVVEKLQAGRTVRLGVSINDRRFSSYAADGLIVATPTGSTAYNLSAGGPILSAGMSGLVVTPVAPHLLFDRSLVLSPEERVRLDVLDGNAVLAVDGQSLGQLAAGDCVVCRAGAESANLVRFGDPDVHDILKTKFSLRGW